MNAGRDPEPEGVLLDIQHLSVTFHSRRHRTPVSAIQDVSLQVNSGETVGLVGESGSGKTTLARAVLGLASAAAGTISFEGEDITHAARRRRRDLSRRMQVVFQDPYRSLSPTRTIGQTLAEPLLAHRLATVRDARLASAEMLERVGLTAEAMSRYPREFSGGQRQRIAIARALMLSPRLVICDEPVSALDLSIQAQILNLLRRLQADLGLSYLFVAHNLSVVRFMSRRVLVLYRGHLMESGEAAAVYESPAHPYTRMLLDAAPVADPGRQASRRRAGTVEQRPAAASAGADGCPFRSRCSYAVEQCAHGQPPLSRAHHGGMAACVRLAELPAYERRPVVAASAIGAAGAARQAPLG